MQLEGRHYVAKPKCETLLGPHALRSPRVTAGQSCQCEARVRTRTRRARRLSVLISAIFCCGLGFETIAVFDDVGEPEARIAAGSESAMHSAFVPVIGLDATRTKPLPPSSRRWPSGASSRICRELRNYCRSEIGTLGEALLMGEGGGSCPRVDAQLVVDVGDVARRGRLADEQ